MEQIWYKVASYSLVIRISLLHICSSFCCGNFGSQSLVGELEKRGNGAKKGLPNEMPNAIILILFRTVKWLLCSKMQVCHHLTVICLKCNHFGYRKPTISVCKGSQSGLWHGTCNLKGHHTKGKKVWRRKRKANKLGHQIPDATRFIYGLVEWEKVYQSEKPKPATKIQA